jgi:hypothetical protein
MREQLEEGLIGAFFFVCHSKTLKDYPNGGGGWGEYFVTSQIRKNINGLVDIF